MDIRIPKRENIVLFSNEAKDCDHQIGIEYQHDSDTDSRPIHVSDYRVIGENISDMIFETISEYPNQYIELNQFCPYCGEKLNYSNYVLI